MRSAERAALSDAQGYDRTWSCFQTASCERRHGNDVWRLRVGQFTLVRPAVMQGDGALTLAPPSG